MENGTYNYFLNGEPTGVSETFNTENSADGSQYITSIRDAKPFKTTIEVKATIRNNNFETCFIDFKQDKNHIRTAYEFSESKFAILRIVNREIVQNETFDLLKNAIFFPLMRCFQGQTIFQVAETQDVTTVIVPDIQPSTDFQDLLKPTFDERTAKLIRQEDNRFIYNYLSKHYDDNSEFHLDENGFLIYYKFHQAEDKIWTIQLQT